MPQSHIFQHLRRTTIFLIYCDLVYILSQNCPKDRKKALRKIPQSLIIIGRGSKIRTHDTRFWRPMLYQLSYTPITSYVNVNTQY